MDVSPSSLLFHAYWESDKLQDNDRYVEEQEERYREEELEKEMEEEKERVVEEQLAMSQEPAVDEKAEEDIFYTARVSEEEIEHIEEAVTFETVETREAAVVKEEQETYEVPVQDTEVIQEVQEMVSAAAEEEEEETFYQATEQQEDLQEAEVKDITSKVEEMEEKVDEEKEESVQELKTEHIEDVVAEEGVVMPETAMAEEVQVVRTEESEQIQVAETVVSSYPEEAVEITEEVVQPTVADSVEAEVTAEGESPITDLKYASLADPVTTELVREKIETIEDVVSKMERKFEMTSTEVKETSYTESEQRIETEERVETEERASEEKVYVHEHEEFRSEITEDVSETTQDFSEIRSELVESLESQQDLDTQREKGPDTQEESEVAEEEAEESQVEKQEQEIPLYVEPALDYRKYEDKPDFKGSMETQLDKTEFMEKEETSDLITDTVRVISTEIEGEDEEETEGVYDGEAETPYVGSEDMLSDKENIEPQAGFDLDESREDEMLRQEEPTERVQEDAEIMMAPGLNMYDRIIDEEVESVAATAGSDVGGEEEVDQDAFSEVRDNDEKEVYSQEQYLQTTQKEKSETVSYERTEVSETKAYAEEVQTSVESTRTLLEVMSLPYDTEDDQRGTTPEGPITTEELRSVTDSSSQYIEERGGGGEEESPQTDEGMPYEPETAVPVEEPMQQTETTGVEMKVTSLPDEEEEEIQEVPAIETETLVATRVQDTHAGVDLFPQEEEVLDEREEEAIQEEKKIMAEVREEIVMASTESVSHTLTQYVCEDHESFISQEITEAVKTEELPAEREVAGDAVDAREVVEEELDVTRISETQIAASTLPDEEEDEIEDYPREERQVIGMDDSLDGVREEPMMAAQEPISQAGVKLQYDVDDEGEEAQFTESQDVAGEEIQPDVTMEEKEAMSLEQEEKEVMRQTEMTQEEQLLVEREEREEEYVQKKYEEEERVEADFEKAEVVPEYDVAGAESMKEESEDWEMLDRDELTEEEMAQAAVLSMKPQEEEGEEPVDEKLDMQEDVSELRVKVDEVVDEKRLSEEFPEDRQEDEGEEPNLAKDEDLDQQKKEMHLSESSGQMSDDAEFVSVPDEEAGFQGRTVDDGIVEQSKDEMEGIAVEVEVRRFSEHEQIDAQTIQQIHTTSTSVHEESVEKTEAEETKVAVHHKVLVETQMGSIEIEETEEGETIEGLETYQAPDVEAEEDTDAVNIADVTVEAVGGVAEEKELPPSPKSQASDLSPMEEDTAYSREIEAVSHAVTVSETEYGDSTIIRDTVTQHITVEETHADHQEVFMTEEQREEWLASREEKLRDEHQEVFMTEEQREEWLASREEKLRDEHQECFMTEEQREEWLASREEKLRDEHQECFMTEEQREEWLASREEKLRDEHQEFFMTEEQREEWLASREEKLRDEHQECFMTEEQREEWLASREEKLRDEHQEFFMTEEQREEWLASREEKLRDEHQEVFMTEEQREEWLASREEKLRDEHQEVFMTEEQREEWLASREEKLRDEHQEVFMTEEQREEWLASREEKLRDEHVITEASVKKDEIEESEKGLEQEEVGKAEPPETIAVGTEQLMAQDEESESVSEKPIGSSPEEAEDLEDENALDEDEEVAEEEVAKDVDEELDQEIDEQDQLTAALISQYTKDEDERGEEEYEEDEDYEEKPAKDTDMFGDMRDGDQTCQLVTEASLEQITEKSSESDMTKSQEMSESITEDKVEKTDFVPPDLIVTEDGEQMLLDSQDVDSKETPSTEEGEYSMRTEPSLKEVKEEDSEYRSDSREDELDREKLEERDEDELDAQETGDAFAEKTMEELEEHKEDVDKAFEKYEDEPEEHVPIDAQVEDQVHLKQEEEDVDKAFKKYEGEPEEHVPIDAQVEDQVHLKQEEEDVDKAFEKYEDEPEEHVPIDAQVEDQVHMKQEEEDVDKAFEKYEDEPEEHVPIDAQVEEQVQMEQKEEDVDKAFEKYEDEPEEHVPIDAQVEEKVQMEQEEEEDVDKAFGKYEDEPEAAVPIDAEVGEQVKEERDVERDFRKDEDESEAPVPSDAQTTEQVEEDKEIDKAFETHEEEPEVAVPIDAQVGETVEMEEEEEDVDKAFEKYEDEPEVAMPIDAQVGEEVQVEEEEDVERAFKKYEDEPEAAMPIYTQVEKQVEEEKDVEDEPKEAVPSDIQTTEQEEDIDKAFEKYEDEPEETVPIDAGVGEQVEAEDKAFEKYEEKPEEHVPIGAQVGEQVEKEVEDVDSAFEKHQDEPEETMPIDAELETQVEVEEDVDKAFERYEEEAEMSVPTEETEQAEETKEKFEVHEEPKPSVSFDAEKDETAISEHEKYEDELKEDKTKEVFEHSEDREERYIEEEALQQESIQTVASESQVSESEIQVEDSKYEMRQEEITAHSDEEQAQESETTESVTVIVREQVRETREVEDYEIELSKAIVQEALHTSIETTRKMESHDESVRDTTEERVERSEGIMAEMQALEDQQGQDELVSEDDLDDDEYEEDQERKVVSEEFEEQRQVELEETFTSETKIEYQEEMSGREEPETEDQVDMGEDMEQSIDRKETKMEKLESPVVEPKVIEEVETAVDRMETKFEKIDDEEAAMREVETAVDRMETKFEKEDDEEAAIREMERSIDREESFAVEERPEHTGISEKVTSEVEETTHDFLQKDDFGQQHVMMTSMTESGDCQAEVTSSYSESEQLEEAVDHPESFIDRTEQFIEILPDVIRPDDDDKEPVGSFQTTYDLYTEPPSGDYPRIESDFSPSTQPMRDGYDQSQGPVDGLNMGLHLPRSPLYPTSSTEVQDRSGSPSDLEEEINEMENKLAQMKQMVGFDEESAEEDVEGVTSPQPQYETASSQSSQPQYETASSQSSQQQYESAVSSQQEQEGPGLGRGYMSSSISGSDYHTPSDFEYGTTGTSSYHTAQSEVMSSCSSTSFTAQSETMTGSEYTVTGSEYEHEADEEEEVESEGRISTDISQQIFIEQKVSRRREAEEGTSSTSSDDEQEPDDGMDRLDRPPSPSEFTLIASQDQERLNISLGLTSQSVTTTTRSETSVTTYITETVEETGYDSLQVQRDTDIERDSLQGDEEDNDYDEAEDEDEMEEEDDRDGGRMSVDDRPPSPSDFTLVASQDQESLNRVLSVEGGPSPEQEMGSPMQWEQDLERAIIDADAQSTASSDAALMIGLDRVSATGTDNNTMSGFSSESGQQIESAEDEEEDRQQMLQAYMKEMEEQTSHSEEEVMGKVLAQVEAEFDERTDEGVKGGEEPEDGGQGMKEETAEDQEVEAEYRSPQAPFDEISQGKFDEEFVRESGVSVTELEENLQFSAQKEFSEDVREEAEYGEKRETIHEERYYMENAQYRSVSEDDMEEELAGVQATESMEFSQKSEQGTSESTVIEKIEQQSEERSSFDHTSHFESYEEKHEMTSSSEQIIVSSHVESYEAGSEYKASCSVTEFESKSELEHDLEVGDHLASRTVEAEEKEEEEEEEGRNVAAAMALHAVDKMSSSSSEVAQLDDFEDEDVEIREVSEETSEETDVEDQFSPVLTQTAEPAFAFEPTEPLQLTQQTEEETQQLDKTPVDVEGHEVKLLEQSAPETEIHADAISKEEQLSSLDMAGSRTEEDMMKDEEAVVEQRETVETYQEKREEVHIVESFDQTDEPREEEVEDIDDTELEPELCGLTQGDEADEEVTGQEAGDEDEGVTREGGEYMAYDNMAFRDEEEEEKKDEESVMKHQFLKQETRDISPEDLEEKPSTFDFPDDYKQEMAFQAQYELSYSQSAESMRQEYEQHTEESVVVERTEEDRLFREEPSEDIGAPDMKDRQSPVDISNVETTDEAGEPVPEEGAPAGSDDESDDVSSRSTSDSGGVEVYDEQTGQFTKLPWEIAHQYKRQFSESFVEEQKSSVKAQKSIDMGAFYRRDKSKDEEFLEKSFYDDTEPAAEEDSEGRRKVTFDLESEDTGSFIVHEDEEEPVVDIPCTRASPLEPYEQIDESHETDVINTILESRQQVRSEIAKQVYDPEFPVTPKQDSDFDMASSSRSTHDVFDESEEDAMFSFSHTYERTSQETHHYTEQRREMISVVSKESRMAQQELLLQESVDEEDRSLSPSRDSGSKMLSTTFEETLPPTPPAHPTHFPMAVHSVGKSLADNEIYESSETEKDSTEEKLSPIEETPGVDEIEEDDNTLKSTPPVEKRVTFQTDRLTTRASEQSVDDFKASSSSSELSVEPTLLAASYDLDSGNVCHVVTAYDISPDTVEKQGPIEIAGKAILSSPEDDVFETDKTLEAVSPEGPTIPRGQLLSGADVCPSPPIPIAPVSTPRDGTDREDYSNSLQSASTILEMLRHSEHMDSKDGEDTTLQEDDMSSPHEEGAPSELKSDEGSPDVEIPADMGFAGEIVHEETRENGVEAHYEGVDLLSDLGGVSEAQDETEDTSEPHVLNGPTEVDYIPEYDEGIGRPAAAESLLETEDREDQEDQEEEQLPGSPLAQPDLIESTTSSLSEAKPDVQQPEEDIVQTEGEEPIQPTVVSTTQAKPDIQQPVEEQDDDYPDGEEQIQPSAVSFVQAKPDIQQPVEEADDDYPDGEEQIQPAVVSFVQAKPDIQQPEDGEGLPEVEEPIQTVVISTTQAKPDIQQPEDKDDQPDGEELIQPTVVSFIQAKPDIQQPEDEKDNGYPVEEPIQPTVTTSSRAMPGEQQEPCVISVTSVEDTETEDAQASATAEDEEFARHTEQEVSVSPYSPEQDEGEDFGDSSYQFSKETVYHGKRALEGISDVAFSEAYEEGDEAVPEGYATSGAEPLIQEDTPAQEGEEELELEEEEEFEERPEEELIRLEEPPAESDDEEEDVDREEDKSREETHTAVSVELSATDLLCVSSGSQSDLDRPLSPTPDALRQGFFGGNFTPPQSGAFTPPQSGAYTPPISGTFTPPQGGQELSGEDTAVLEKTATSFVDSILEDVKVKVSSQATTPEDVVEHETKVTEPQKSPELEGEAAAVAQEEDKYPQDDEEEKDDDFEELQVTYESGKRSGVTLVKQISEDIPGIILTQHLHEEMNEDEYYGYSPQPESISEDEEDRYIREQQAGATKKQEVTEATREEHKEEEQAFADEDEEADDERDADEKEEVVDEKEEEAEDVPFEEQVTQDTPDSESAPIVDTSEPAEEYEEYVQQSFLVETDPGSGFVFTETTPITTQDDEELFMNTELGSGSGILLEGGETIEPMLSPEDHGDTSSVDSFATVVAAEAAETEDEEPDENRLAEIASMTSSFTSDIQVSFPDDRHKEISDDPDDTEDDELSLERSQEWMSTTPDDKERESDASMDSDKFEFVDRAALSIITEMSDEDKFEMIEREDLESEAGLSDHFGSSPDTNIQQSPGISNLRFFGKGAERDDSVSISSSLAEFEKLEKAIPISSSMSSLERDVDKDSFGGSYDERKLVGFSKLKEGDESTSIASSLAEFEHLEQVLVVSSSTSSVEKHTPESKSSGGSGENTSNSISSSLAEFERIEHECQGDSDEKKSSVESSSRQSEASSCTSLNEFERLEREIAVANELEEEAQKIVSILESGVLMESARFGSSDFSEVGGGDEREERDSLDGNDDVDHDSLSEGARLGHDGDADSLDGESSEMTEMTSSVVFAGPEPGATQPVYGADLDTDSLQGEAVMQLSSDSLTLEQRMKTSDSAKFDTDSLQGLEDRMIRSADSLEFGGHSSGHSSEKQEDRNVLAEDPMQTSADSLELDNSKEEAKESEEKDDAQDDSLMMVSVESAAWSMGSSGGTGHSMSESHTDSSHSHDIMQVSTESDKLKADKTKTGAGPEKSSVTIEHMQQAMETITKDEYEEYHQEQHWHQEESTVQHVSTGAQPIPDGKSKTKRDHARVKEELEDSDSEDSPYLAWGPYQETKKVYTMTEWEEMKRLKKEKQEAKSSALSSSPDLSQGSDRDDKFSPPTQFHLDSPPQYQMSMTSSSSSTSASTTTTRYSRGEQYRDDGRTSEDDDEGHEAVEPHSPGAQADEDVQTHRVMMKKEVHKKTTIGVDGQEETTIREDSQVQQENEPPEELRESMQEIINQFMETDPQPAQLPPSQSHEEEV